MICCKPHKAGRAKDLKGRRGYGRGIFSGDLDWQCGPAHRLRIETEATVGNISEKQSVGKEKTIVVLTIDSAIMR